MWKRKERVRDEVRKEKFTAFSIILFIGLLLLALSLVVPFVWALVTSLKTRLNYAADALGFPSELAWQNYADAFKNFTVSVDYGTGKRTYNLLGMLLFSLVYSLGGAVIQCAACVFVAYAVARFKNYKTSKLLYGIVIVTMILPIVGALPSEIRVLKGLGIYNTIFGILFMKASFLGTYFLVFHSFFAGIPKDYYEAASLDGAGNFQILFKIVLPMAKNLIFTIILLYFIGNWNDYNVTLVYAPSIPTLAYGLYEYNLSTAPEITSVPHKMAGAMMLFIPIMIFFCVFANKLISGNLTMGGVKE